MTTLHTCQILQHTFNLTYASRIVIVGEGITGKSIARFLTDLGYFFVLVDSKRHIRGYYDARYISEIKRLIEEYQHLRLKHEKKNLINQNKIENK